MATWKIKLADGTWKTITSTTQFRVRSGTGWLKNDLLRVRIGKSIDPVSFGYDQQINVEKPTDVPGTPTLSARKNKELLAEWTNTSSQKIIIGYRHKSGTDLGKSFYLDPLVTSHIYSVGVENETFDCRVAYYNDAGTGPWSAYSNEATTTF